LIEKYAPADFEKGLNPVDRARLEVLRKGDTAAQLALARVDRGVTAVTSVEELHWEDGLLVVTASATLTDGNGDPVRVVRSGDRWLRQLPDELDGLVSAEALDVTDALAKARVTLSVRGRGSRSSWPVPSEGHVTVGDDGDGTGRLVGRAVGRFDVGKTRDRQWDTETVWDFAVRLQAMGYTAHCALAGGRTAVALTRGRPAIAYENGDGNLSLDVSNSSRTVLGSAEPTPADVSLVAHPRRRGTSVHAIVALPKVHTHGEVHLEGEVLLGEHHRSAAVLLGDSDGARLEFRTVLAPGRYVLETRFNGRTGKTGLCLVAAHGSVRAEVG
jgi:hypothetical protein